MGHIHKSIELNETFETRKDLFVALKKNKAKLIAFKKAQIYNSISKGQLTSSNCESPIIAKTMSVDENFIVPVINTTDFVDSHLDNHQKGIWNKSIQEQTNKIRYSFDHSSKIEDVIAWPDEVEVSVKTVKWSDIGFDYEGETQALLFKIAKSSIDNDKAIKIIDKRRPVQNSVSMQYVKMELAIDSNDEEFKAEKKTWNETIGNVANKNFAIDNGYFWNITEAKIVNEGSMVISGSNSATPILYEKQQPGEPTEHKEPLIDSTLTKGDIETLFKSLKK